MNLPVINLTVIQDFDGTTNAIHVIGSLATKASLLIRSPDVCGETGWAPTIFNCLMNARLTTTKYVTHDSAILLGSATEQWNNKTFQWKKYMDLMTNHLLPAIIHNERIFHSKNSRTLPSANLLDWQTAQISLLMIAVHDNFDCIQLLLQQGISLIAFLLTERNNCGTLNHSACFFNLHTGKCEVTNSPKRILLNVAESSTCIYAGILHIQRGEDMHVMVRRRLYSMFHPQQCEHLT